MNTSILRRNAGYTIDQTILIVAIIAILITLIIASVGWDLLSRTGGTKVAAFARQVEDANSTFFARNGIWLPDALLAASGCVAADNSDADTNIRGLAENLFTAGSRCDQRFRNLLPGFENDGTNLLHSVGGGGIIMEQAVDLGAVALSASIGSGTYLVVEFEGVPRAEYEAADEAVDGTPDATTGRILAFATNAGAFDCNAATAALGGGVQVVDVCYVANLVN